MMTPDLYRSSVIGGALAWTIFGLSLGMTLQSVDAGEAPSRLQVALTVLAFVMGVGDVRWLFRHGMARSSTASDTAESVV